MKQAQASQRRVPEVLSDAPASKRLRLIRLPEVLNTVGVSRSGWYRLISIGAAPRPVPLGSNARAWEESEVQEFVAKRIVARDTGR